jgi:WD40 repeat protein
VTAFADDDFIHAAVSADGAHMTVIGLTKQARVWDLRDGRIVASLSHEGTVSWVVPGSASGAVATASEDGTVKVWEIPSARERARISHGAAVDFVAFVGGDDRLVSFTREPAVHVTRLPGGEVIARFAGETFDLSPDGRYVAMADADGGVRVCSSAGATLAAFEHRGLIDLYAGPNALVATRGRDLSVRVWDPYAPA